MASIVTTGLRRLREAAGSGELAALCRRHRVELLVLFGSGAADDLLAGVEPGDIDLAVRFVHDSTPNLLGLYDDLFRLVDTDRVDVMDLGRAGPVAKQQALTRGQPLHEAEQGAFARAQMAAIGEFMDTEPLRRLQRELLRE